MSRENYYQQLGVKPSAPANEIKAKYRALAKKYHPDKNIGNKEAEERFKEIQEAYHVLSNQNKRRHYDLHATERVNYYQTKAYTKGEKGEEEESPVDKTEWYHFAISVGVAVVLLYFIVSYSLK
ncbi:MAG: DnaJ domain-containing protein [Bacteroidota bacterium]